MGEHDGKTPPTGTVVPITPTLKTLNEALKGQADLLQGLSVQVGVTASDVERLRSEVERVRAGLVKVAGDVSVIRRYVTDEQILRISTPLPTPSKLAPARDTPTPESRPSMAVRAKAGTTKWGKRAAMALGVVTLLVQLAAPLIPKYSGPIVQILRLLAGEAPQ